MAQLLRTLSIAGTLALAACAGGTSSSASTPAKAAAPASDKQYSAEERKWMTLCSGMTDTAWTAAQAKKRGEAKEALLARYPAPSPALAREIVEKVYKDEFQHPWDYSVACFKECAAELAKVPADRVGLGAYCVQNMMIAAVAFDDKTAGVSRERAHEAFATFKSETPRQIVDRVYASSRSRGETLLGEWESCIAVVSE